MSIERRLQRLEAQIDDAISSPDNVTYLTDEILEAIIASEHTPISDNPALITLTDAELMVIAARGMP
ncbi:MAG: hypothetical protein AAF126_23355 [Chloroflexota bacterium]